MSERLDAATAPGDLIVRRDDDGWTEVRLASMPRKILFRVRGHEEHAPIIEVRHHRVPRTVVALADLCRPGRRPPAP